MKYCETCHATYPTAFNTCPKDQTVLRVVSELMPGLVIRDKYQIVEKIGSGGMATVYRVKHLAFNEERAIKVVSSKLMDDPNFLKRFRTEALVTRKLQHPNAVRVDDLDTTEDGRLFMVMEYVNGRDLRSVLQHGGPLPLERALHVTWQVASALATAHQLGITHRDIKPENILLVPQTNGKDLVKVLDFGIAKVREGAMDLGGGYTATQTGMVVGTPQYISPEQAMGKSGDQIDGRADLYSLGVVIYEMLTGRQPFESDTAMGLLLHHLQTTPTPAHLLRPELNIPPAVSMVLMKALEKDPAKRFQSANEMLEALTAAKPNLAQMAGAATDFMTPTVMSAAAAAEASAAAATPTMTPTVGVTAPMAPAPKPAVASPKAAPVAAEKTVAIAPPRKTPATGLRIRPTAPPRPRRSWTVPATVALLVVVALGVAWQRRKGQQPVLAPQATSIPTASTPDPALSPAPTAAAETTPEKPASTVESQKPAPKKAEDSSHRAKAPSAAETAPVAATPRPTSQPTPQKHAPEVMQLVRMGKQQYDNGKYIQAMKTFRAALDIDPTNQWAQRGMELSKQALQQKSEQVLQNDQAQQEQQGSAPRWRKRRPN